jgi:tetratricopeptide (TPR) repeat protein
MNKNICKSAILRGGKVTPLIIPSEFTDGLGLMNPTIIKYKDTYKVNVRWVQYALYHSEFNQEHQSPYGPLVYLNPEDDVTLTTKNYLCDLDDKTGLLKNYQVVDTSKLDVKPIWEFVGLEDVRLVNWDKKLLFTGVRRDTTPTGIGRMEISEIKNHKEISRKRIEAPKETYCEKNWMPILDMENHYVKWTNPTEIVKVDTKKKTSKTIKLVKQKLKTKRDLRGGSQVIKYKDYWVCVTHEVDLWKNEQGKKDCEYYHRFIVWDKDWKIVYNSEEFKFMDARIEFSCGMHYENEEFHITFGYQDTTAFLLKLPADLFEEMVGIKKNKKEVGKIKTDSLLYQYIENPHSYQTNYDLGIYYYELGHFSSALSFFLRSAELDSPENLVYQSLLFIAKCIQNLGRREYVELALWNNALRYKPNRPEAYLFLSQYYEARNNFSTSQSYARIGLEFKDNCQEISHLLGYEHFYQLQFQDALCCWNLGQGYEARKKYKELGFSKLPINKFYKNLIQTNITSLGSSNDPFLPYDKLLANNLRFKFKGYDKIEKNYSQTYQDMFVLSMLDGKKNGEYFEIGSADPYKGSNTALLEELGWTGISLEILEDEVVKFRKHRKNPVVHCDATMYDYSNLIGVIDYLQIDCEPPATTFEILTNLPLDKCDFKVITYEHDHYTDISSKYRELSRLYLLSKGYKLVVKNIAPDDTACYEDWYVHPKYISMEIFDAMFDDSEVTKNATNYMLPNKDKKIKYLDTSKVVANITEEELKMGIFHPNKNK